MGFSQSCCRANYFPILQPSMHANPLLLLLYFVALCFAQIPIIWSLHTNHGQPAAQLLSSNFFFHHVLDCHEHQYRLNCMPCIIPNLEHAIPIDSRCPLAHDFQCFLGFPLSNSTQVSKTHSLQHTSLTNFHGHPTWLIGILINLISWFMK